MKKSPDTLNFDGNTAEGTEEEGAGSVPDAPPPKVSPHKLGYTSPHKDGILNPNAKRLLQSPLGTNIDTNFVAIGNPEQIVNEEHLEFAKFLHETVSKLKLKAPNRKQ